MEQPVQQTMVPVADVTVTADWESYRKSYWFFLLHGLSRFTLFFVSLGLLAAMFTYYTATGDRSALSGAFILWLIFVVLFVRMFTIPTRQYKIFAHDASGMRFIFYPEQVQMFSWGQYIQRSSVVAYPGFIKVLEAKTAFYLQLKNYQYYLLPKKYMQPD